MIDSDSDTDLLANNAFTSTSISAKGPNTKNINLSFRNNAPISTMNMSRNIDWPRSTQSIYGQRSATNRRELSPMSIRSAQDFRGRNFHNSLHASGMSSQRSVFNGRSGSPMSMRSSASNFSAVDIATAIKNAQFSKSDLKLIQNACHKLMKHHIRKKIEKRRNLNVFLKGARRRSSSERELSDSSLSSDDCKSTRTSVYKENMSSCRSTRTDISKFRRTLQETNMYKDCSANFKQNSFRNMFSMASSNANNNNHIQSQSLHSAMLQKDRFKSSFLLPSQRFNKSIATTVIPENMDNIRNNDEVRKQCVNNKTNGVTNNKSCTSESEQEEIFSEISIKENCIEPQRKRNLDKEDSNVPDKKRNKLSPIKKVPIPNGHVRRNNDLSKSSDDADELLFIKPALPVRKITKKGQEKLLATSSQPFIKPLEIEQSCPKNLAQSSIHQEHVAIDRRDSLENHSTTSEVAMRPSFIKRKLFSQKLDIAENRNAGIDHPTNSPQTVYSSIQKEKNKTRKLVTSQSCLIRDVQEGNNMLDLIHKIVPPDRINVTIQTNKSKPDARISENKTDIEDKWDVTSIISTCDNDNMSDTYTDEEIFEEDNTKRTKNANKNNNNSSKSKLLSDCKIVIEKIKPVAKNIKEQVSNKKPEETINNNVAKMECIKSFWETGFESDLESIDPVRNSNNNNSLGKTHKKYTLTTNKDSSHLTELNPVRVENRNVTTIETKAALDNTIASVHKFNNTSLRIRSHRAPKRKKCCSTEDTNITKCEPQNKNKKSRQDHVCKSDALINVHANGDIEATNDKNGNTKRKYQSSKKNKQNLDSKLAQRKLNTSQETNKGIKSKLADSSSAIKESDATSKPTVSKTTSTKRTCRTPKQTKEKIVTQTDKSNFNTQETNASIKSRHIDQPTPVITKNEAKSKLKINNNSSYTKRSRQNKQQTNYKPDSAKLNNTLESSMNLRSRHIDLSISSNKENDTNSILLNGRGNRKRACRTPKLKHSFERKDNSKIDKSASDFDDSCRNLRSRQIDLSMSIENEKFHTRSRPLKNKNLSKVFNKNVEANSSKSDISFSLVPNKKPLSKYKRG